MSAPSTTSPGEILAPDGRRHEVLGILAAAATVLMGLALWSYDARGADGWVGPVGASVAGMLVAAFGVAAWVIPFEAGLATIRLFGRGRTILGLSTLASTLVTVLVGCALLHLVLDGQTVYGGHLAGGVLGEVLGEVLRSMLGLIGAYVVGVTILMITFVLRTPVSLTEIAARGTAGVRSGGRRGVDGIRALWDAWREAKELEAAELDAEHPKIVGGELDDYEDDATEDEASLETEIFADLGDGAEEDEEENEVFFEEEEVAPPPRAKKKKRAAKNAKADPAEELEQMLDAIEGKNGKTAKTKKKSSRASTKKEDEGPTIVAPVERPKPIAPAVDSIADDVIMVPSVGQPHVLPPTTLLDAPPEDTVSVDVETLRANAARLVEKLEAYGVKGRVDEIHPGPVVTMYEFEPQSGTKISKIAGLADDLAMALAAQKVRIVAPIPGKARVGFELPNKTRQTVYLREILEDPRWAKYEKAHLPMALGQDIGGQPVYADLARMPHMLVAGATGAGKSVGLNVMLASLLSKKSPDELRLLMIDPKVVELAVFDGIPHMLLPVVTDMKKASLALRWAVDEMERRYQLFADAGARNITSYNQRVQKVLDGDLAPEKIARSRVGKVKAQGANGEEVLLPPADGEAPDAVDANPIKLPFIVVIVDEFADLMMVAAKDVESAVARLAQKARAAGIHVILATQRPSVDVITGMIKANFPTRMAFKVSQREDSKTILGRNGAEHLLGMGDMLMLPPGQSDLKRVHSAFISEDEVRDVCDFLRAQGNPIYDTDILKPRAEEDEGGLSGQTSDDPLYDKAVSVVAQAGYCSISHIQRKLSVGYNKAAKLVDRMEEEGVVGPAASKAGGRREVLVQPL
ncbi:MAG: DNA translocase FtsK 4TM domain-containing protein [Deltaproteobacteria bacterium]|nr:DNA translocase FtsK 4TM domain-containing protein [Deltaproteobacteria bacterium]